MQTESQLNKSDSLTHCLCGIDDIANGVNKVLKNRLDRLAFKDFDLTKRYSVGDLYLVLDVFSRFTRKEYQLLFFAIPILQGEIENSSGSLEIYGAGSMAETSDNLVFGPSAQFVHGPEHVIPSLVWLEPTKYRIDLCREVFAASFETTVEVLGLSAEGKVSVTGRRIEKCRNGVGGHIQSAPKIFDDTKCSLREHVRQWLGEFDLMQLFRSIVVEFNNNAVRARIEEPLLGSFKVRKITLCPTDSTSSITKLISHGKIGDMKSNANSSPEYQNFDSAMRKLLHVSKAELQRRIEADKAANDGKPKRGPKPKTSASGHASHEEG